MRTRFVWSLTFLFIFSSAIFATEKTPTVDVISAEKLGDFWGVEFPAKKAELEATRGANFYIDQHQNLVIKFYEFFYSENQQIMNSQFYDIAQKKIFHQEIEPLKKGQNLAETKQGKFVRENNFIEIKPVPIKVDPDDYMYGAVYYPTPGYRWSNSVGGDICRPPIESTIRVQDLQKNTIAEKTLLYSSIHKKVGHHSAPGCADEGNGSGRPRKLSTIALNTDTLWRVDDSTVLAKISNAPYVIRLTSRLTSLFLEHHPDLRFFKPGLLKPLYDQLFEQHWKHADKTDGKEDVYEIIDEILFRYVQQYGKKEPTSSALPTP